MYNLPNSQADKEWCPSDRIKSLSWESDKGWLYGYSLGYSFRTYHLIFNLARQYHSIITTDITSSKVESGHQQLSYLEISIKILFVIVKTDLCTLLCQSKRVSKQKCPFMIFYIQVEINFSRPHIIKSVSELLSILLLLTYNTVETQSY